MTLDTWPLAAELADSRRILLSGAGGGFDIYSGLPLYFMLKAAGKEVFLSNLSFAHLPLAKHRRLSSKCAIVDADLEEHGTYCPEYQLTRWFRETRKEDVTIYCFPQTGVAPLRAAYRKLVKKLDLDTILLVDGGTDSLMRGDEVGLGTPQEDIASLSAVADSGVENSYLAAIGFGIDTFHGVCHSQFLEAVADLTKSGHFLGVSTVLPSTKGSAEFCSAVDYANEKTPRRESIVQNSLYSAISGDFGDHHRTQRTSGSRLWINPVMPIYWVFELSGVIERNLYIDQLSQTESMADITTVIKRFRGQCGKRGWDEIPA